MATKKPGALSKELEHVLRARMAYKRILQTELADRVGISQAYMSGILNSKKHVDVERLDQICWALGLNFRDVIAEIDEAASRRHVEADWTVRPI